MCFYFENLHFYKKFKKQLTKQMGRAILKTVNESWLLPVRFYFEQGAPCKRLPLSSRAPTIDCAQGMRAAKIIILDYGEGNTVQYSTCKVVSETNL